MSTAVFDELIGLTDSELAERIAANELERRRLDAEMAAALALAKHRNLNGMTGHRTMAAYCRATLNWSSTEAGRRLGLATAVDEIPGLADTWADGHIGLPQALKLAATNRNQRVADHLPAFAPQLLQHAEQMPYVDFVRVVDHFVACADADGAHRDRDADIEARHASVVDVGGTLDIHAAGGDGLTAAEMIAIHARYVEREFRADLEARREEHGDRADEFPLRRTDRQRRFDALVAIFRSAANADEVVTTPSEPLVNVVIDSATWGRMLLAAELTTSRDLSGRRIDPFTGLAIDDSNDLLADLAHFDTRTCETADGAPLHPHDVLRAALAGHIRRTVVDSDRVVIDHGRRQRLFTGSARTAAKLLIRHCEHAGCELPADWCDIDHDQPWVDDGDTDQRNAAVLCRGHNNEKHRHRWRTKRARNGSSYTIRDDGTIILPVGARPPEFPEPINTDPFGRDARWDDPEWVARFTADTERALNDTSPGGRTANPMTVRVIPWPA